MKKSTTMHKMSRGITFILRISRRKIYLYSMKLLRVVDDNIGYTILNHDKILEKLTVNICSKG